jgi:hypothetical protein
MALARYNRLALALESDPAARRTYRLRHGLWLSCARSWRTARWTGETYTQQTPAHIFLAGLPDTRSAR